MSITSAQRRTALQIRIALLVLAIGLPLGYVTLQRFVPSVDRPSATVTAGQRLILPSITAPTDSNYAFVRTQPNSAEPVAFDPCRPIHYVVRPGGAPPGGMDLLHTAINNVSAATGLQFVDDGVTDEAPSELRPNYQPDHYGDRWAPVLISWSTPEEYGGLAGQVIGLTGSEPVTTDDGQLALVSGHVTLDAEQTNDLLTKTLLNGRSVVIATITHELGHLVGLAHVNDLNQLMYPTARPTTFTFGSGDLTGLAALGSGRCFDEL
ncbi:MAG: matrixin family metalloprotease [Actinomycetia bacterium]|nr:matrixin family metalloprotease [Actinomycetes bacterium]